MIRLSNTAPLPGRLARNHLHRRLRPLLHHGLLHEI